MFSTSTLISDESCSGAEYCRAHPSMVIASLLSGELRKDVLLILNHGSAAHGGVIISSRRTRASKTGFRGE